MTTWNTNFLMQLTFPLFLPFRHLSSMFRMKNRPTKMVLAKWRLPNEQLAEIALFLRADVCAELNPVSGVFDSYTNPRALAWIEKKVGMVYLLFNIKIKAFRYFRKKNIMQLNTFLNKIPRLIRWLFNYSFTIFRFYAKI